MMAPAAAKDLECPEHQHAQQQHKPQRRRRTVVGSLVTAALAISGVALLVSNSTSTTSYPGLHALSTYELKEGEALIHTGDGEHIVSTQEHARKLRGGLTVGCAQSNWKSIFARQAETGAQYQSELIYQGVRSLSYQWQVRPILNAGKQVVFCLEFFDSYSNLWDIAYGKYDGFIKNFANDIRNGGRQVTIRPLHEFNGDWYNWGTGRGGSNSKDAFKAAYRKVVNTFRGSGAPIRSQLSFNCAHPRNAQTSYWEWWPGSEVVDTITCSAYNRAGSDYWHQKWERFSDVYNFGYWQMNALPGGKSLGVAETSSSSGMGGNKPQWIRDAFNDLLWKFPRVNAVDWFLINKWDGDWDLNSWSDKQAWGERVRSVMWMGLASQSADDSLDAEAFTTAPTSAPTAAPTSAPAAEQ